MLKFFTLFLSLIICISNPIKSVAQINSGDSLALVALYNNTNGAAWLDKGGWLTSPVSNWDGIVTSGNRVTSVTLNSNNLVGTIPSSLGNLTALNSLVLGNNQLSGTIPTTLGNLTALNSLVLGSNQLTGSIPTSFGSLSSLAFLDISNNQLTGSIPTTLGNLTNLGILYLYNNQLAGSIPTSLGNLTGLSELELNNNQLTGSIPVELGNLASLGYLDISSNQLSDTIPASFGTLFSLNTLYLYNNQLTGSIPASLGGLFNLQYLSLGFNQLSGSIPASIDNLSNLQGVSLTFNQLSGSIPASLGKSNIFFLDLSHNLLSGTVPSSFVNLTNSSTAINYNKLTFDGLELLATSLNAGILLDSPQAILSLHLVGSTLSVYAGGTLANDTFHWFRDGVLDTTIIGDSTFHPTLSAHYSVVITNKIVSPASGLALYSDTLTAGTILPLTFLNFTGTLANNNTLLQWKTGSEINTSYFNVQRSTNGTDFITVGKVNATGNFSGSENYHYTDDVSALPDQSSTVFYRLQEVDKDGSGSYSNIVAITLNTQTPSFTIYPNPVKDILNIALGNHSGNAIISAFDNNGRLVLEQKETVLRNNITSVDATKLSTGVYFIKITINGSTLQQKFIKK